MCKYFKTILFFFNKCYRIFGFFLISLLEYFLTFLKVNILKYGNLGGLYLGWLDFKVSNLS